MVETNGRPYSMICVHLNGPSWGVKKYQRKFALLCLCVLVGSILHYRVSLLLL